MLKTTSLISSLLLSFNAYAARDVSVKCHGSRTDLFQSIDIEVGMMLEDWLRDVKVTTVNDDGGSERRTTVGRAAQLDADEHYNPRKYKDHVRYDLTKLTETKNFGRFIPGNECYLSLMIPKNASALEKFSAPIIANCEQNGGSMTLQCETRVER